MCFVYGNGYYTLTRTIKNLIRSVCHTSMRCWQSIANSIGRLKETFFFSWKPSLIQGEISDSLLPPIFSALSLVLIFVSLFSRIQMKGYSFRGRHKQIKMISRYTNVLQIGVWVSCSFPRSWFCFWSYNC